jgi:hypothetical protein
VVALLLGRDTRKPGTRLAAHVARLVAPDGGFAQVSAGYARLLLDVLSIAEWLRRRHGAPPFPAPLAARAAALAPFLPGRRARRRWRRCGARRGRTWWTTRGTTC